MVFLKTKGKVLELNSNNTAKVKVIRHSACRKCGICQFGNQKSEFIVEAMNLVNAHPGEIVEIEMEDQSLVIATIMVYLIPLLGFIFGVISGIYISDYMGIRFYKELFSVIMGILLMGMVYVIIKLFNNNIKKNSRFIPKILSISLIDDNNDIET